MQTFLRSTCQYTMIPAPPYRWCHSVMKFADHDPNLRESDAHAVPGPHREVSRASRVLFTTVRIAARRLSRLTNSRRVRRSAASVSASMPGIAAVPSATRLIPMFVPSPNVHSSSLRRSTAASVTVREATEANSPMNSVAWSTFLIRSRRSMTPHRLAISSFSAPRFSGSACLSTGGTLIHGSPFFLVILTPPVLPFLSPVFSPSRAATCRFCRSATKSAGSRGLDSAR